MSAATRPIEELLKDLPQDMRAEVYDFVEFLIAKRGRQARRPLRQDWAGALREYRERYTSVDLQHRALDWRDD
jgi:hypothetical protein